MNQNSSQHTVTSPRRRPQFDTYRVYHDDDGPATLSTAVVHAVADVAGVDARATRVDLHESVDVAALDRLFASGARRPRFGGQISFYVWEYYVTAYADGEIVIQGPVGFESRRQ